jgi:alpha-galactosidase
MILMPVASFFYASNPRVMKHQFRCKIAALLLSLAAVPASFAVTNNLALTPPMGWNDWNSYGCGITESAVTNTAYMISTNGMKAAGYQFINIDDCGLSGRDANGVLVANATKFPHGFKWVADITHSLGLKQGVYSDRGTNTCSGLNSPGSYGHEYLDALTFAAWGADYLKEDNCKTVVGSSAFVDYGRMSDGLMKSRRPITFCICGNGLNTQSKGFVSWSPTLGNQWRTTGDIGDTYASMISKIDPNSTTAFLAGPGRWNDPDMLEVGRGGMTDLEYQTHFTMWCVMAAPLIMGNNLTTMSASSLATLTNPEAIAVDQDPAGEQGVKVINNISAVGTNEVWSKTLGYDFSTKAVVLFNRMGPITNVTVNWTNLGLRAGAATVRDLWAHIDLGTFTNSFTATIAAHGVGLYEIVGLPPILPGLGTNYLTDLQAVYAYTGSGTIVKDKSIGGNTITLGGATFSKGIGVNSRSGANYDLGGVCSRFRATIGVDDEVGSGGSVVFQVFADGLEIYNSGTMTGSTPANVVDLDVTGVHRLILGVNDADDGTSNDHGDWANAQVVVTNTSPRPPHAPTGLTAAPGNSITLAWNATLAATTYNVKRSTHTGGAYTLLTNVPLATFTDATVLAGTNYFYVVSAVSSAGESSNSTEVSVTPCNVPLAPTNLVTVAGNGQAILSWSPSAGATSYQVWRFTGNTPPAVLASGITATNYTDTTAANGATYYYIVSAANACNQSGYSAVCPATIGPVVPAAPATLSAIPGNGQINLNWSTSAAATGYNVKRSTVSGGPYLIIGTNVPGTSYLDAPVSNGTTYYYVVSGVNAAGEGTNSVQVSAVPTSAVTAYWTNTVTGAAQNWNVNANWTNSPTFPNSSGEVTVINANIAAPQTINLNQAITIGSLQLGDVNGSAAYTLAANGGSLAFGDTNTVILTELASSKGDIIAAPVNLITNVLVLNNSTNPLILAGALSSAGAGLTVGSGTLQVGDGATNGSLGAVNVTDNGALVFNRADNVTNSGTISGTGALTQNGSGTVTLTGTNTYTGSTLINTGTLAMTAATGASAISVAPGATFQMNGNYKTLTLSGAGVWNVNAGNGGAAAVSFTVSGNVSGFSGTANVPSGVRYWVGSQASMPGGTMIVADGGQLGISNNGLLTGNVHLSGASWAGTGGENDGALRLNASSGSGGNFAGTLTLDADAAVAAGFAGGTGTVSANIGGAHTLTILNGVVTLSGNNVFAALNVPSGSTAIAGSVTGFGGGGLTANGTAELNGFNLSVANLSGSGVVGNYHAANASVLTVGTDNISTSFNGVLLNGSTAALGLTKVGAGALTLGGVNLYTGTTTVSNGWLIVNGSLTATGLVSVASAGALGGVGAITGAATVDGTLAPGTNSIGIMTFSNQLTLTAASSTIMEVTRLPLTNDLLRVGGTLGYGGTLVVTNSGANPLSAGDSFKLFNAPSYSGAFARITPAMPGSGLAWNTSGLTNGILAVVPAASPHLAAVAGGTHLIINATGGPPNADAYVLSASDLTLPLNQWTCIATGRFDPSGSFFFTNSPSSNAPRQFLILKLP